MPEYLNDRGLQRQHHQSYNDFINNGIQKTVEANKMVRCNNNARWYIEYTGIRIGGWDLFNINFFKFLLQVVPSLHKHQSWWVGFVLLFE